MVRVARRPPQATPCAERMLDARTTDRRRDVLFMLQLQEAAKLGPKLNVKLKM